MNISRRAFVATSLSGLAVASSPFGRPAWSAELAGEDGSKLWLRYAPPGKAAVDQYRSIVRQIMVAGDSPTARVIREEVNGAVVSMLGSLLPTSPDALHNGAVLIGTHDNSSIIRDLDVRDRLKKLGPEGFLIRSTTVANHSVTVVAAHSDLGALYGAFHFLRLMATGQTLENLDLIQVPKLKLRMVNQWDNLDGGIERGYAGKSLWQWNELPKTLSPRYRDYARANASIGINGATVNNVNANPKLLSAEYLPKVAALAEVWRPYGVRMYLSANFAAPNRLGDLDTADPLDPRVADWWKAKADEIYKLIPDFGGFLVKANSEGQPGPKDYGRNHAEGAQPLADALASHGGNVIWRAFIYDEDVDPDRAKRAYIEFMKLEGQFRPNVLVQVKNGAIDFQPREPFHPLFGALRKTPIMAEIQPTQEYLGQAKHLVYLGTMWKEFLDSDTHADGAGSTVGKVLEAPGEPDRLTGMAGVLNPGLDANWCGHDFSQANWYAFGRLAWDYELSAEQIADEWIRQTFTNDQPAVAAIRGMMMSSWETFVSYTMPVGLHHLIGGNHYAPMPENAKAPRPDWTAVYYHQASPEGVGFNRTRRGNKAVEQYYPPVCDMFDNLDTCPEKFLLWFHRCPWDHKMKSGRTLWEELCSKYSQGAAEAAALQTAWANLSDKIDPARHKAVADRLATQAADAAKWRDHCLKYFQQFSGKPIE